MTDISSHTCNCLERISMIIALFWKDDVYHGNFLFNTVKRSREKKKKVSIYSQLRDSRFCFVPPLSRPCKGSKHKYTVLLLACVPRKLYTPLWLKWRSIWRMQCQKFSRWTKHDVLNRKIMVNVVGPSYRSTAGAKKGIYHAWYLHPFHSRFHSVHPQCIHRNVPSSCPHSHCAGSPALSLSHAEQQNGESPQSQAWHSNTAH